MNFYCYHNIREPLEAIYTLPKGHYTCLQYFKHIYQLCQVNHHWSLPARAFVVALFLYSVNVAIRVILVFPLILQLSSGNLHTKACNFDVILDGLIEDCCETECFWLFLIPSTRAIKFYIGVKYFQHPIIRLLFLHFIWRGSTVKFHFLF